MNKKLYLFVVIFLFSVLLMTACDQMGRVRGVKEKGEIEEEPSIVVKTNDGEEEMKLEKYVQGVVAGEMHADWPENAYGAQAILARTFALKYLEDNNTKTISSEFSEGQQYSPEKITKKIENAVKDTKGEVVLYNDQYIKGWFHASAGGMTTTAKVGLAYEEDEPKYIKSVESPDDKAPQDIKNWKAVFKNDELLSTLKKMGKNISNLEKFEIVKKDKTGRAEEFKFAGDNSEVVVKAANFRKELDPKKLKSIKISNIKKLNDGYEITGSGYGHGVGLSQWGAYSLALDRKDAEDIINYYYKDIKIEKLYE